MKTERVTNPSRINPVPIAGLFIFGILMLIVMYLGLRALSKNKIENNSAEQMDVTQEITPTEADNELTTIETELEAVGKLDSLSFPEINLEE